MNAYPGGGSSERCSVTYTDAKSSTNSTYALTAGHCGVIGHDWYQGYAATPGSPSLSRPIGSMHTNGFHVSGNSSNCDCAALGPLPSGYGTNRVMTGGNAPSTPTTRVLNSFENTSYVGEYMCSLGAASWQVYGALECGDISHTSSTSSYGGFVLTDSITFADMTIIGGDSGALIIAYTALVAIDACGTTDAAHNPAPGVCASKAANLATAGLTLSFST